MVTGHTHHSEVVTLLNSDLWCSVFLRELCLGEGADVVSHLFSGGDGQLHQPLDDGVDVDEVEALDLVGLQAMGTLHPRQDTNYLLR